MDDRWAFTRWAGCFRVAQYESRAKLKYKGTIVAPASNLQLILEKGNESVANASLGVKICDVCKT
jgi:hypothetical protein